MSVTLQDSDETRFLYQIAAEIRQDWTNVYFGAVPYLEAMETLYTMDDSYGHDPAAHVVRYFLSNAKTWRGETARRVKAELEGMLKR
jgi:hypothetical protein